MYKAVIWDVDGTLIGTRRLYPEAYRRALAHVLGHEPSNEEMFRVASHSELGFLRAHAGERYDDVLHEFRRQYAALHASHFDGVFPGVREVLEELRRRGVPQGIVTGKSRESFAASTLYADLGQFDVLVMDDDVSSPKPHPEGISAAIEALHIQPAQAVYVGDSITDAQAAHAAGAGAAAALWSRPAVERRSFLERLAAEPYALVLEHPQDLLPLL